MSGERRGHILVVDDDNRLRRLLQRYLTEHGYHVTTAADANEAKAALKNFAFDLMVLDVMLPGQNGISLTGELPDRGRPADPAADRARRERRSGQRPVRRRRRLPGQAVRSARAAAQDRDHPAPRGAAWPEPAAAAFRSVHLRSRAAILWRGESASISPMPSCRCCRCWPSSPACRSAVRIWGGAAGSAAPIGRSTPRSPGSGASWSPIRAAPIIS